MVNIMRYVVAFVFVMVTVVVCATVMNGKGVGVTDGDTIKVLIQGEQKKIRLYSSVLTLAFEPETKRLGL